MSANPGSLTALCMEPGASPHTFDTNSEPYRFWVCDVARRGTIIDPNSIQGTRSHVSERTRSGPSLVRGKITMPIAPLDLDRILERALGGTKSGDTIAVAETVPAFGLLVKYYSGQTIEYTDCKIDRMIIQGNAFEEGQQPEPIQMTLEIVGLTAVVDTSYPVLTLGVAAGHAPYTFCDVTSTQVSAARKLKSFTLVVDNHLEPYWRNGSCTPIGLMERDRTVTLQEWVPYISDNEALYAQSAAGTTGTLVFTNGTMSCTFTFGVLQAPVIGPVIQHKNEVLLPVAYQARSISTTKEVVATNDSTA